MNRLLNRLRRTPAEPEPGSPGGRLHGEVRRLSERVAALEEAVQENRRLNQRLADVIDVVSELLIPAADRDDEKIHRAVEDLHKTLDDDAPRA
ncbi:MAG: hypothetical protein HOQ45_17430 [Nocardioidaceae bacterium]|nr:hypothetical protein [Nocardioidaceae bacterium]